MDKYHFFELLKAADDQAVAAAIAEYPDLVIRAWDQTWSYEWNGTAYVLRGDDGGFGRIPYKTWAWAFRLAGYREGRGSYNDWNIQEVTPAALPDEPILVYRGCSHNRRLGISWTPIYDLAAAYCRSNGAEKRHAGNIYSHWAWPEELLAHTYKREKCDRCPAWVNCNRDQLFDEYILDPAYLNDKNVDPVYVSPLNYSAMSWAYAGTGTRFDLLL